MYGEDGSKRIKEIMQNFRENPPKQIGESKVVNILDYNQGIDGLPKSDVLKFFFEDGWFAVRPSGTEPKIKFYFGLDGNDKTIVERKLQAIENVINGIS